MARISFSPETKAEAMRLIFEEGFTAKQAAEAIGCSTFSIQNWKAAAKKNGKTQAAVQKTTDETATAEPIVKSVKKTKNVSKKGKKKATKKAIKPAPQESQITFDEFVHGYWSECEGATDVLRLPPVITPQAVQYVNNVLQYAYDRFCG